MGRTPPDYTTIRIWTRTLRSLRLIAALTGERMVHILDRVVSDELKRVRERERQSDGDSTQDL